VTAFSPLFGRCRFRGFYCLSAPKASTAPDTRACPYRRFFTARQTLRKFRSKKSPLIFQPIGLIDKVRNEDQLYYRV